MCNTITGNHLSGVRVEGDFIIIEENRIAGNRVSGVFISATAMGNLVIQFPFSLFYKKKEPRGSFIGFLLIHFSIRIYTNIKHPT